MNLHYVCKNHSFAVHTEEILVSGAIFNLSISVFYVNSLYKSAII